MSIVLVGGFGQLGSEIYRLGRELNYDITRFSSQELDICDANSLKRVLDTCKPSMIINTAAYTAVDTAEMEPERAFLVNAQGPATLASYTKKLAIPIIHISTDYVFDGLLGRPYNETDFEKPLSVYGKTKLEGDKEVQAKNERHIILRTSGVFSGSHACFPRKILTLAKNSKCLDVVTDQLAAPTSATSLAEVILFLIKEIETSGSLRWGLYHFCQRPFRSWFEFAQDIFLIAKEIRPDLASVEVRPVVSNEFPSLAKRPEDSRLQCFKIQDEFRIPKNLFSREDYLIRDLEKILRDFVF